MMCARQVLCSFCLWMALALGTSGNCLAQGVEAGAFSRLQLEMGRLLDRVDQRADMDSMLVHTLAKNINELQDRFSAAGENPPTAYAQSLRHQADELALAVRTHSGVEAQAIVGEVAADIALKVASMRSVGFGFGGALQTMVNVTVKTMNGQREEHGLLIRCNPRRWREQQPMFVFNNPSSPVDGMLPPGRFTMNVLRNGVEIARQDVEIGLQGQKKLDLVLLVP